MLTVKRALFAPFRNDWTNERTKKVRTKITGATNIYRNNKRLRAFFLCFEFLFSACALCPLHSEHNICKPASEMHIKVKCGFWPNVCIDFFALGWMLTLFLLLICGGMHLCVCCESGWCAAGACVRLGHSYQDHTQTRTARRQPNIKCARRNSKREAKETKEKLDQGWDAFGAISEANRRANKMERK